MIPMKLYNIIKYTWLFAMTVIIASSGYIGAILTNKSDLKTSVFIIFIAFLVMIPNALIAGYLKNTKIKKRKFENRISKKYHAECVNVDDNLDTVAITRADGRTFSKRIKAIK